MKDFKIIDNRTNTMGTTLPNMISKSSKSLYCGIGYFLDSGYKNVQNSIIDIANNGADVRIIAGNLFIQKDGIAITNPDLDKATCELLVNIYDNGNNKILVRSIKEQFFHGKFFLGIGKNEAYLIGGSSNMSYKAMSSSGNIEYNFYTQDKIDSDMITQNMNWFLELWDNVAVTLNPDNIEEIRFLLNKMLFNIDVKEDIHESGLSENKSKVEIQCEIINSLLKNIGINTVEPVMTEVDKTQASDNFVWIIHYLYSHKEQLLTNSLDSIIESLCRSKRKNKNVIIGYLNKVIKDTTFREYYYEIVNRILHKNISSTTIPDYATFLNEMIEIFSTYYELYHNKAYKKGSYGTAGTSSTPSKTPTVNAKTVDGTGEIYKAPNMVSDNRFEYLLKTIGEIRGSFEDEWLFQYQSHDVKDIIEKYDFFEKGAYIGHEAGMGKSPIMCKFIKEIQRKKWDTRTLIAVPASLMRQWKNDNLLNDFGLQSEIIEGNKLKTEGNNVWTNRKINIVSIDFLKNFLANETSQSVIDAISPDILIVDEAHLLKNEDSARYAEIGRLKPKFILLASATPLQNAAKEFLAQLHLIDNSVDISESNDMDYIRFLRDKYLIRRTRGNDLSEIKSIKQATRNVSKFEIDTTPQFKVIYDEIEEKLKGGKLYYYKFLGKLKQNEKQYRNIDSMTSFMLLQQITSSITACIAGFTNLKNKIEFIINNDVSFLNDTDIGDYDTKQERELLTLLADRKDFITDEDRNKLKDDIEFINEYIDITVGKLYENGKPKSNPKESMFAELMTTDLNNKQVIVFVKYIATGVVIKDLLAKNNIVAEFFQGSLSSKQRDDIVQKFKKEEIQVLIATDSANAGLNLQTGNILINYDLNWNPQVVEQRIGRVHRIGQKSDTVKIFNLIMKDTVDSRIAEVMEGKEETFTNIFTTSDIILGRIAKHYMSGQSFDNFNFDFDIDVDKKIGEEISTILEENVESTKKLNNDYYYMIEALREVFMWIMRKYTITYYTKDNEEYYIKLTTGDTYLINLNQVYNMIDKEHEFFKDFDCSTPITNKKHKKSEPIIEGYYFSKEVQSKNDIITKLNDDNVSDEVLSEIKKILITSIDKVLLLLNLDIEYEILINEEKITRKEFKSVVIAPDNSIYSNIDIVRLFYIVPSISSGTVRIETIENGEKYIFIYNELLQDYLIANKQREIKNEQIKVINVSYEIYNGTIINVK